MSNNNFLKCTEEEFRDLTRGFSMVVSHIDLLHTHLRNLDEVDKDNSISYYLKRRDLVDDARIMAHRYLKKLCTFTDFDIKIDINFGTGEFTVSNNGVNICLGCITHENIYDSFTKITGAFFDAIIKFMEESVGDK